MCRFFSTQHRFHLTILWVWEILKVPIHWMYKSLKKIQIDKSVLSHHIIPQAVRPSSQERSFLMSIKLLSFSTTKGEKEARSDFHQVTSLSFVPLWAFAFPPWIQALLAKSRTCNQSAWALCTRYYSRYHG